MSKLPTSLVVGRYVYSVTDDAERWLQAGVDGIVRATGFGASNHITLEIILNPVQNPMQKADTLIHEALHCLWHVSDADHVRSLKEETDVEEFVIGHLSPRLTELMANNPDMLKYIKDPT